MKQAGGMRTAAKQTDTQPFPQHFAAKAKKKPEVRQKKPSKDPREPLQEALTLENWPEFMPG